MKKNNVFKAMMILSAVLLSVMYLESQPVGKGHHEHHHHLNEIGISLGIVRMHPESETAPGLHLHAMRRLGDEGFKKLFGIGAGVEIIFSEHTHTGIMGTLGVFPWKKLVIALSPGLLMLEEDGEKQNRFSFHGEVMYEFEVGPFDIGPALGFAVAGEDTHYTMGVHFGMGF